MASNYTSSYQLCQWEAEDKVLRTEFNADNTKIDAALAGLAAAALKLAVGTYTGDGTASRVISVGFTPKAVLVCTQSGLTYSPTASGYVYGGLAVTAGNIYLEHFENIYPGVEIVTGGFQVYQTAIDSSSAIQCNNIQYAYHYLALG